VTGKLKWVITVLIDDFPSTESSITVHSVAPGVGEKETVPAPSDPPLAATREGSKSHSGYFSISTQEESCINEPSFNLL
jgi:hypothetical protein